MNTISLSECGQFVELWNNGNRIYYTPIAGRLHDAVGQCREHCRKWSGDESPTLSKDLKQRMNEIDSTFSRLAFAAEWR